MATDVTPNQSGIVLQWPLAPRCGHDLDRSLSGDRHRCQRLQLCDGRTITRCAIARKACAYPHIRARLRGHDAVVAARACPLGAARARLAPSRTDRARRVALITVPLGSERSDRTPCL